MHSSNGCIVSTAIDTINSSGSVCQTLKFQLAKCDLLELDEKNARLLIIVMCNVKSSCTVAV